MLLVPLWVSCETETKCHTTLCLEGFFSGNLRFVQFSEVFSSVVGSFMSLSLDPKNPSFRNAGNSLTPRRRKTPCTRRRFMTSWSLAMSARLFHLCHVHLFLISPICWVWSMMHSMWSHRWWVLDEAWACDFVELEVLWLRIREHFPFVQGVKRGFSADRNLVGEEDLDSDLCANTLRKTTEYSKNGPITPKLEENWDIIAALCESKGFFEDQVFLGMIIGHPNKPQYTPIISVTISNAAFRNFL